MSLTKEDDILTAFSEIKTSLRLVLRNLDKYFTLFPNLLWKIGTILIEKIESLWIQVDILDFWNYIKNFGEDLNMLCKLYILQHKSYKHFDYSGKALIEILQSKPEFLLEYITYLYSDEKRNNSIHNERLWFIWRIAGIELYLERIIDFIIHQDKYYFWISEHFLNSFFTDIEEISLPRAQAFIRAYVESYFFDTNKMNLIVDVLRHTMSPLFEEILLRYLELTQDLEKFNAIHWIENWWTYSWDTMFWDIEAWRYTVILDVIKKSKARIEVIPIKTYLLKRIDESKRSAEWERRRRFIEKNRW